MAKFLTEAEVEQALLETFRDLEYEVAYGPDIAPNGDRPERESYGDAVLTDRLRTALFRNNPHLPPATIADVLRKVLRAESPGLLPGNRRFHKMLSEGVEIEVPDPGWPGGVRHERAYLLHPERDEDNDFLVVNQHTFREGGTSYHFDAVVFLNGLPVAAFELKEGGDEDTSITEAFDDFQDYKERAPGFFLYNEVLVVSDGLHTRAGTLTADWDRFAAWKSVDGHVFEPPGMPQQELLVRGMFERKRLPDLLRFFIVYEDDGRSVAKKLAGYHQYFAVNEAVQRTVAARPPRGDRRIGVFWHTQGSGKSLSMVFYAAKIARHPDLGNPTLVVLTDRNDLDDQLFGTFARCSELLRQTPVQAGDRGHLRELVKVAAGGIVFTTLQKFLPEKKTDRREPYNSRGNVVVIADEAHRSHYEFRTGLARNLRDALPRASFIGFTGTPIDIDDRNTAAIFGDYIRPVYDIERSIRDEVTVPIYYETRLARISLREEERPRIDPDFEEITEAEEVESREKLKTRWTRLVALVGAKERLAQVARDLVEHFEARDAVVVGKGMVVCMSRQICVDLYREIVALRPEWHSDDDEHGAIKVVMSGAAPGKQDEEKKIPQDWQPHVREKSGLRRIDWRFKDPADPLKLVLVRDMWLTGFDVPSLHTMYLDKPMKGHTLMQAIARVNRRFRDKPGGLIVDYLGLAEELREAVRTYSSRDGRGWVTVDVEKAVALLMDHYEVVKGLFHGFDLNAALYGTPAERMAGVQRALEHITAVPDRRKRFLDAMKELGMIYALAGASDEAAAIRDEVSFFQYLRALLLGEEKGKRRRPRRGAGPSEEVDTAVRQIVSRAVASDEVVDIFAAAGLRKPGAAILSDEFLEEIRGLPHKNLSVELLRRLIAGEIQHRERKNLIQARTFSSRLEDAIRRYENRTISTLDVVDELLATARDLREAGGRGEKLGLSEEELAFYDALETNDSAVAVLGDETLRTIARELTRIVRANATVDWNKRESSRANLRALVRRVLKRFGYPPDKQKNATDTVLLQAETIGEFFEHASEEEALVRPFRTVPPEEVRPFENAVPVYDLAAAAGSFSDEQQVMAHPERFEWAELPDHGGHRPRPGLFVARIVGESMNRVIPNGAWCLFRLSPQGSREGKIVLVEHREIQDTDLGGHYTVKRYRSEKRQDPDGGWQHTRITLSPETDREGYQTIELEPEEEGDVRVIAEWLGVIG